MKLEMSGELNVYFKNGSCFNTMSNYSLIDHPNRYEMSLCRDFLLIALSIVTLSGAIYGFRHLQLPYNEQKLCREGLIAHKVIGAIECIPLIGLLAMAVEGIFSAYPIFKAQEMAYSIRHSSVNGTLSHFTWKLFSANNIHVCAKWCAE